MAIFLTVTHNQMNCSSLPSKKEKKKNCLFEKIPLEKLPGQFKSLLVLFQDMGMRYNIFLPPMNLEKKN